MESVIALHSANGDGLRRVVIKPGQYTINVECDDAVIISRIKGKPWVTHTLDVALLTDGFAALERWRKAPQ